LRHWLLQTPGEKPQYKEKKKDDPSLAIGENYINKMFLFFKIKLLQGVDLLFFVHLQLTFPSFLIFP